MPQDRRRSRDEDVPPGWSYNPSSWPQRLPIVGLALLMAIAGPIAASFAVIAIWETTRGLRWCNLLVGLWQLLAPWVLGGYSGEAMVNSLAVGALLIVFSFVRGKMEQSYGGGWLGLGDERNMDVES